MILLPALISWASCGGSPHSPAPNNCSTNQQYWHREPWAQPERFLAALNGLSFHPGRRATMKKSLALR